MSTESAPQQLCTFNVGPLLFGVDVRRVQEVSRAQPMTRVPLAVPAVEGLLNLRGQIVTALDLRRLLRLEARPAGAAPLNVVVRSGEGIVSLLVDEIGDVVETRTAALEARPETLDASCKALISGVYKLERRLLLLLNTDTAIRDSETPFTRGPTHG